MIRVLGRDLIIPRGDSGSFSVPIKLNDGEETRIIFSIYDELTRTTIFEKEAQIEDDNAKITLDPEDTEPLTAGEYFWDVKIYRKPTYDEEGNLNGANEVDSLYAAYGLPSCSIRQVCRGNTEFGQLK
jgi:hypothetical protein